MDPTMEEALTTEVEFRYSYMVSDEYGHKRLEGEVTVSRPRLRDVKDKAVRLFRNAFEDATPVYFEAKLIHPWPPAAASRALAYARLSKEEIAK